jgi:hypothetical protein
MQTDVTKSGCANRVRHISAGDAARGRANRFAKPSGDIQAPFGIPTFGRPSFVHSQSVEDNRPTHRSLPFPQFGNRHSWLRVDGAALQFVEKF